MSNKIAGIILRGVGGPNSLLFGVGDGPPTFGV